jgi:hypothetical protein
VLSDGWYLMSNEDLERELMALRSEGEAHSNAKQLSVDQALAYRDAGNLPDELGRTLRLVLTTRADEVTDLATRRLTFEPDYHDAPRWRRKGSRPVNVVPLRVDDHREARSREAWWDDPEVAALENEWRNLGTVAGVRIPGAYRGFVFKTVLALKAAGRTVSPDSVADSVSRWLPSEEAQRLREELRRSNPNP